MSHAKKLKNLSEKSHRKYRIEWHSEAENSGKISINNAQNNKSAEGLLNIAYDKLEISLFHSDYNKQYLIQAIKNDLKSIDIDTRAAAVTLRLPGPGSTITTKSHVGASMDTGMVVLPQGTYFHSVDSDLLSCNGWPLPKPYRAQYLGTVHRNCNSDMSVPELSYSILRLI